MLVVPVICPSSISVAVGGAGADISHWSVSIGKCGLSGTGGVSITGTSLLFSQIVNGNVEFELKISISPSLSKSAESNL